MTADSNSGGQAQVVLAAAIRDACVEAALDAYENARMDGLCHDGAWEVAVGAMRALDVERLLRNLETAKRRFDK